MIKRLLAVLLSLSLVSAQAATTQPSSGGGGGGGVAPGGTTGQVQTNNGSGGFTGFSLNANDSYGQGSSAGQLLYVDPNNVNQTKALAIGTYNGLGGSVFPLSAAAAQLYGVTQGLMIDPRYYGAACNARYFDGRNNSGTITITSGSQTISIGGYTFTSGDVGKNIAINAGGSGTAGIPLATITAVNTGNNTATINQTPTVSTNQGYGVLANDDTTAFHNAGIYTAAYHGSYIVVPDNCAVRNLTLPAGVTMKGQATSTNYGYNNDVKPILYILATGYSEDTGGQVGINITGSSQLALANFMIKGPTFPYLGLAGITLACVGTTSGNAGNSQGILLDHMGISFCPVAVGNPYTATPNPSGYIFGQSNNSEFSANGWGMFGNFSDWTSTNDTFTGNFSGGTFIGPVGTTPGSGGASKFIGSRWEENGTGVHIDSAYEINFDGCHWQFNKNYGLELVGKWQEISVTSGFMQGNGVSNTTGHQADILLAGVSGAAGHFHLSNVTFDKANYAFGGQTQYVIDSTTAGTYNPDVEITGGTVSNGYTVGIANWEVSQPTLYKLNVTDVPMLWTGNSSLSINAAGGVGIGTAAAATGTALDMSANTAATNSSMILPGGTTANRPSTGIAGMLRYNSTLNAVEAYAAGVWASISAVVWPTSGSLVVSAGAGANPTGLAESDGSCVVGAGGVWTTGSCSGTSNTNLGSAASATSPQRSGEAGTGFYSSGSGLVDIASSGLLSFEVGSVASAVNYYKFTSAATGNNPTIAAAGSDSNIGLNLNVKGSGLLSTNSTTLNFSAQFGSVRLDNTLHSVAIGIGTDGGGSGGANMYNTAIGIGIMNSYNVGNYNTGVGYFSCNAVTTGTNNECYGAYAGTKVTTGTYNLLLGDHAGAGTLTTGSNNIVLSNGASVDVPAANTSNWLNIGNAILETLAAPTVSSGFGTSPTIVNGTSSAAFTVNVGTGGTATSGVIAFPTAAPHGWACNVTDSTNVGSITVASVPTSTTTATWTSYSRTSGTAAAWNASDVLVATCSGY